MNYPEFETTFEARLQTRTDAYPHAVAYHRARFTQTIQSFERVAPRANNYEARIG